MLNVRADARDTERRPGDEPHRFTVLGGIERARQGPDLPGWEDGAVPDLAATPPTAPASPGGIGLPPRPEHLGDLPPRPPVIGACVLLAVLLGLACCGPAALVAVVVLGAGLVVANGWTRVLDLPSRKGTALVAVLSSLSTTVAVLASGRGDGPDSAAPSRLADLPIGWLPVALAVSVVGAFAHQLLRTDGRPRVVVSLSGSLLALALLASGACWIAVPRLDDGRGLALAAASALVVGVLVEAASQRLGHPGVLLALSMAAGGVTAGVVGAVAGIGVGAALLAGVMAAAVAFGIRALLAPLPQLVATRAQLVSGCASVLAAGGVVLLVGQLLAA